MFYAANNLYSAMGKHRLVQFVYEHPLFRTQLVIGSDVLPPMVNDGSVEISLLRQHTEQVAHGLVKVTRREDRRDLRHLDASQLRYETEPVDIAGRSFAYIALLRCGLVLIEHSGAAVALLCPDPDHPWQVLVTTVVNAQGEDPCKLLDRAITPAEYSAGFLSHLTDTPIKQVSVVSPPLKPYQRFGEVQVQIESESGFKLNQMLAEGPVRHNPDAKVDPVHLLPNCYPVIGRLLAM